MTSAPATTELVGVPNRVNSAARITTTAAAITLGRTQRRPPNLHAANSPVPVRRALANSPAV